MRIVKLALAASASTLLLAGCASGGLGGRSGPDEFAVARNAPLVVPPDFALTPPRPGEATPATDSRNQAIQALFGGPAPRSAAEQQILQQSGVSSAAPGARSVVGDPQTTVVDKGATTQTILAVPEGDGQEARTSTPK
jgi:hypothetical protein